jgi:S-adenosylmethionine-diacylglycerol 3-amino-3-carboxypropyl transferase
MSESDFEKTVREIERVSRRDTKLAFWTLLVPRTVSPALMDRIDPDTSVSEKLFSTDRTFFYRSFEVWRINRKEAPPEPVTKADDYLRVKG